ncbi:hypothetical protein L1887_29903 [Cichorium endivia]|nr:hypothetical protein L1887_29903 [Cichorium endivia]
MSGVSLAVAPHPDCDQKTPHDRRQDQTAVEDVMESLRVIDLQLVAFITVFSASGFVPLFDLLFPAFTSAYLLLLSQLVFPEHGCATTFKERLFQSSRLFTIYVIMGLAVGLFLPLAYVLGGFARGDDHADDVGWYWFGRILAIANLAYYSINLFAFLIPRYLPRAFEQYFKERNEIQFS